MTQLELAHQAIGELVVANRHLQDVIALYQNLLGQSGGLLYENLLSGLPPAERRLNEDVTDAVLAKVYGVHDG